MAVHQAELELAALRGPRPKAVLSHIAGTLVVGDGDRVKNTEARLFGENPSAIKDEPGIQPSGYELYTSGPVREVVSQGGTWHPQDVWTPSTTAEICNPDDIVCDPHLKRWLSGGLVKPFQDAVKIHEESYIGNVRLLIKATNWVAGKVKVSQH